MKVFLWVLSEAGVHDVPSLYHLRQVQASIRKTSGVPTIQQKSAKGNVYSLNDPRTLVAMVSGIIASPYTEEKLYLLCPTGLGKPLNMWSYSPLSGYPIERNSIGGLSWSKMA